MRLNPLNFLFDGIEREKILVSCRIGNILDEVKSGRSLVGFHNNYSTSLAKGLEFPGNPTPTIYQNPDHHMSFSRRRLPLIHPGLLLSIYIIQSLYVNNIHTYMFKLSTLQLLPSSEI